MSEIEKLKKEYEELSQKLSSKEVLSDMQGLHDISKRHGELKEVIELEEQIQKINELIKENHKIIDTEKDPEMVEMATDEADQLEEKLENARQELKEKLSPAPGARINEVIIEIRPGVGGEEAALFAQNLFRMYTRYAQIKGWKVGIIEENKSELKGIKGAMFEITGKGVYSALKNESGVQRVQRIPETEKMGRIHTSTASVAVLPKAKPIDIEIRPEDIKVETFRSSGPGGQNVNKVETAVRITYLPTGIAVASQVHKSQAQNREAAMTLLRSRLLAQKQEEEDRKRREERKGQIGTGERSEKIRTYNFPQDRVTDHRINKSWHNLPGILDGNIDKIVQELKKELE
ncbi:MAG: peptide chain release factor 1 [Candidatus Spechtbacteria bacterium RIFCSPLOWO2_01_FULL_43_12]|uniref:Peptide chain release factor 1 n=1 Tax=Candidatus Spechtbacteria bacterium RIFCSPLOWO2_01_FULL_43_12 TaxID=1802162 RepID=A0A1G2HFX0_9BACT|nr:MAG: peptide chain release factor 1 [Candidatus Spechtbacteria bacterium RIFCSPLOWO2_01_FULL_43_12]